MTIKVDLTYPNLDIKLYNLMEEMQWKICTYIEQEAKDNAPVNTGVYRSSINYDGNKTITANASYSAVIEYGFAENDKKVYPTNKKAIAFEKNGQEIIRKWTRPFIKGRKPNPVMRNATRKIIKDVLPEEADILFKKYLS